MEYFHGESLHRLAFRAMEQHEEIVPFGGSALHFKSFVTEFVPFTAAIRAHPHVIIKPVPAASAKDAAG